MPAILDDDGPAAQASDASNISRLPFPPTTKEHIVNCSYHSWHPKYRTITPKTRLVPLTKPFLDYLRSDGIVLPSEDDEPEPEWSEDSGIFSASDGQDEDDEAEEEQDVSAPWRDVHEAIRQTIDELGGKVVPKLNWSAPKDATWMSATNSMECRSPNDVYLLLKSSDFITHDLEHAFDDAVDRPGSSRLTPEHIPYHLALRKYFEISPSVEFRCFVRGRKLIALCQRDLNHFDFLFKMCDQLRSKIQEFFDVRLRDTFPDADFAFDVYVPPPFERVWLVDINPWAPRTDPLLFSWMELLTMDEPPNAGDEEDLEEITFRVPFRPAPSTGQHSDPVEPGNADDRPGLSESERLENVSEDEEDLEGEEEEDVDEEFWRPEFRLVKKSDPEAFSFNTPQYSAHKLPKDVVDASQSGEGLREFARDWREMLAKRQREDEQAESSETD